jgi:hypothetical protein
LAFFSQFSTFISLTASSDYFSWKISYSILSAALLFILTFSSNCHHRVDKSAIGLSKKTPQHAAEEREVCDVMELSELLPWFLGALLTAALAVSLTCRFDKTSETLARPLF